MDQRIQRFGSGGAVATSFANSTGARPFGMALQADGAIVVVGIVEGGTSTWTDWGMARYLPNGTLDPSFGAGGLVRMEFPNEGRWLTDVTVAPNGKILVSGSSNRVGMQFQVARFNSNGTLDASFGTNGIVTDDSLPISSSEYAAKVMLQPDGKILLAGKAGKGDGQNSEFAIYRYHSNGTKDTSFSGDGFQKIYVGDYNVVDLQDLDMQADGKILLNGYVGNGSFKYATVIRLNSNGSLDTSFDGDGYKRFTVGGSSFTQSMAMALDDEGKIVLAGKAYSNQTTGNDLMLVRLNSNGSFDTSFDGDGHALFSLQAWPKQEYIYAAAFQSSGKLAALLVSDGVEQVARFSINSPRHILASDTLDVSDDGEPGPPLVVTIDRNQVFEYAGTGAANVTIQRSGTSGPLTVTLTSSDTTELVVQPTVTIPDGQSSVVVPLDAVDDTLLDDPQTVIITASASGYSEGSDSIIVAGFEDLAFSIDKASIAIGGETATATLTRLNTDVDDPLIVNVQYENATDLVVPDLVEIPAGQQSVTFQIASSDNGIVEGNRTIQFVVHQTGYFNAADTLEVREGGIVSVDSVADGHATDVSPLGSFDSVATPTFELETRVTPTLERRSLFEFDISSLTGSLDAASLTLRTSGLTTSGGVGPTIEVFGYVGDGALSPTDAELGQKVGELQIPGDGTGMRRYGIPLDLSFMQSAIGTNQYIGFSTRIASGSSVSFVSSRNTFSHESNHPKLQFAFATQTSPVANDDLASTDEDTAIAIDVLTNDSGSGLTVSSTTVPSNGTAIINPDNTITYTPNANFNGTDSFVYTMSDGSESDSASVTITVNPINDPPVAANDEYFTSEDTTLVVTSTLGPPALDQQSLAFDHFISTTAFQLQQQVKVGTTGRLNSVDVYIDQGSSAALGEFPGTEIGASLTVYINRGATWQTDAHDFSTQITINSSMINNWVTIDTSSAGIDLAAGEVFMLGTQGASGGVFLAESREENAGNSYPDGQLWRDGAPHVSGSSGFDLRFRTSMRPEVSTEGVLNNDSDHDGDSLTAVVVSTTANGNLSFNANGTFSYVPNTGFFGVDSFTYKAHDGTVLSNEATVSITVTHVNHQPDAVDDIAMTDEDTSVIIDVRNNDTDSDGDSLLLLRVTQPANGQAFIDNNQNVLYIPAANFNGADSFTYTLSDGNGGVDTATVNVTVNSVNDTPQASNDSASTDEDTSVTIDVLANDSDVDGDNLTVTSLSDPTNGTAIVNIDGTVTYSPAANFYGTDTFTYRANDGTANSNLVTVTITVRPVNDAPVARDDAFTLYEDSYILVGSGIIFGNDTDVDNTSLTAVVNQRPTRGSLALNSNGSFRYDPGPDFNGIDTFTYRAHDGNLSSNAATVTLTVLPSNDAPDPTADTYFLDEDVPLTIAAPGVLANDEDIDGDSFTARLVTVLMNGSLQLNPDGSFTYTPNPDFHGVEIFSYVADDGIDESFPVEVLLVVRSVEDAPRAANDTYVTQEDTTLQVAAAGVLANDIEPDGDPLTASLHTPPSHGSVSLASDGSFVYSPVNNYTGPDSFTYFANDGKSNVDVATVSITVTAVNDAPVARNDSYSTDEDSALTIAAPGVLGNDTDVDGDTLSAAVVNNPGNGSLTLNDDGSFTYTPNANFNGADSFSYSIDDGNGGSDTATVQIEVRAVNDDPDVMDAVFSLEENSPNGTPVGAVAATDLEGDLLQFAISGTDAAAFAIDSQTGRISVVDAALLDFETQSQFDFLVEVTDGKGGHSTASVLVNLTDVLEIAIDVLPNDPDNQINLKSKEIEVAILGSAGFDLLAKVDLNSVRLSVSGSSTGAGIASHRKNGFKVEQRDVNGDGILDLVMKFNTSEIGLQSDDTSVQLTGDLLPGLGIDSFLVEQAVTVGGGGGKGNGGGKGKNK